jgi:hypothetical protein
MKGNKDRDEVLAAVKQNGRTLQYADESLKKDKEIGSLGNLELRAVSPTHRDR